MGRKAKERLNLRTIVNVILQEEVLAREKLYEYIIVNILPDIYNKAITSTEYHGKNHTSIESLYSFMANDYAYWENFVGAYSRKDGYPTGGTKIIREDIKQSIEDDLMIIYKETDRNHCTVKQNMIEKVSNLVENNHLFENKEIFKPYLNKENLYYERLVNVCNELYLDNKKESIIYLFFLLILVAIYQKDVKLFQTLYTEKSIKNVINQNKINPPMLNEVINNPAFVPLDDIKYCHKYHVYLYKARDERKYQAATLEFQLNDNNTIDAVLELKDQAYNPKTNGKPYRKIFNGKPLVNKIDKLVFTIFVSSNGSVSILVFKYDLFEVNDLEYRTALFISSYSLQRGPQVQKVVISIDELNDNKVIDGILKMSNNQIVITEESLNQFIHENNNQKWMSEFKKTVLPFIKDHEKKYYSFDEDEIISYTKTELEKMVKIDIAKQLKSFSISDEIIDCIDYDLLRRVVKNYQK